VVCLGYYIEKVVFIPKKGYVFNGLWYSVANLKIINGELLDEKPVPMNSDFLCHESILDTNLYRPFDYYYSNIESDIVQDITGTGRTFFKLHTLFSSLNPNSNDQILKWCKHFGLPTYLIDTDSLFSEWYHGPYQAIGLLFHLKHQIQEFKIAARISELLATPTTKNIDAISITSDITCALAHNWGQETSYEDDIAVCHQCYACHEPAPKCPYCGFIYPSPQTLIMVKIGTDLLDCNELETWIQEDWRNAFKDILETIFDTHLKGIHPYSSFDNQEMTIQWDFDTLLSALYFMLATDIAANRPPAICNNKLCGNIFTPTRDDHVYCDDICKNRAKQQRHRAKNKKAVEQ